MDPNETLTELRGHAARVIRIVDEDEAWDADDAMQEAARMAELVQALDEWILKGGFLPVQWERARQSNLRN